MKFDIPIDFDLASKINTPITVGGVLEGLVVYVIAISMTMCVCYWRLKVKYDKEELDSKQ